MWIKVAWIFVWMTLAFWVGCGGENQNYKINLEQDNPLQERSPTGGPGASAAPIPPTIADAVLRVSDEAAAAERGKSSLQGIDRGNWAKVAITPESGLVQHHPAYFNSESLDLLLLSPDRPSSLKGSAVTLDLDASADAATSEGRAHFNLVDTRDLLVAPLNVGYEIVTFPAAAVVNPPWLIK